MAKRPAVAPLKLGDGPLPVAKDPKALLKKKMEQHYVQKITNLDASTIDNLFKHIASDEDIIDKASFKGAMAKAGVTLFDDDRIVSAFWDALDVNHDGSTNKKELMVGMMTLASGTPEQKLRLSFAIFDFDHSGAVSRDELKTMITAMARPKYQADDALSKFVDTSVEDVFTRLDGDGNKELSADEFVNGALANPTLIDLLTVSLQSPRV